MSKQNFDHLHLTLISGKFGAPVNLLNQAYTHWRNTWRDILVLSQPLAADSFLRQDAILVLRSETTIVGLICASYFDASFTGVFDLSYLHSFPRTVISAELGTKARRFMSIEYLSVDPQYRKHIVGLSLGSVLLGLSMKFFEASDANCVLGTARSKIPVDEMCFDFGFTPYGSVEKFGHPCTLIVNNRTTLHSHPEPQIATLVEQIWSKRLDLRPNIEGLVAETTGDSSQKKAA